MRWSFVRGRRRPAAVAARVAVVAMLAAVLVPVTSASGAQAPHRAVTADGLADLPAVPPVTDCAGVTGLDLDGVTDAPVTISSATVVTTGAAPYCEVRGTIAPANTIVMRLPVNGWTQRYVQTGCGGLCGNAAINYGQATTCPVVQDGTVASATTDMGHQGQNDGSWALDDPQAQIDFAYRGVHVTSQVAKAVIARFYGKRPAYSYFTGCSDGGREALMEAQRYPDDFDGIAGRRAREQHGRPEHLPPRLERADEQGRERRLHPPRRQAAPDPPGRAGGLRRAGRTDGRAARRPAALRLRPEDAGVRVRSGPVDVPDGGAGRGGPATARRSHRRAGPQAGATISHEWGSEPEWTLFVPKAQGETVASENFVTSFARYLAYPNAPDPQFQLSDLDFTVESFWRTVQSSSYLAAMDPDLGAFEKSGGKLLLWHGWNDQHISPQGTLAYYDALRDTMGARTADRFAKLYMFPGVAHCGGGDGPNTFDVLTPVMAWAESATAPGRIVASKSTNGTVTRTRPVYPYPKVARYDGTGSVDDAANFVARTPSARPDGGAYDWLGERLYSSGYQTWCRAVDGRLVCRPTRTWLTERERAA